MRGVILTPTGLPGLKYSVQNYIETRGWALDRAYNSRRPLDCLQCFCTLWPCDLDLWPFDLILFDRRGLVTDYPYGKIGDCSFSRFGLIMRTDRHTQTGMNALLTRLPSAWVIIPKTSLLVAKFACFAMLRYFRDKTIETIINLVEYSNKFAAYSNTENNHALKLLDNFARHIFAWRKPYPKFRLNEASEYCI